MSPIAGKLVTEALAYDGGRQVTAYIPPAPPEAIVFAGDGQLIASWGGVLEVIAADSPLTWHAESFSNSYRVFTLLSLTPFG